MAFYPKIDSPCPYKANLAAVMDGDFCRMCRRNVFDLSAMDDEARRAFLAGCEMKVCVSYKVPIRPAIAAAALAAAAVAVPAAAQDAPAAPPPEILAEPLADEIAYDGESFVIIVGGIDDPAKARHEDPADASVPELPIVYEDEAERPAGRPAG